MLSRPSKHWLANHTKTKSMTVPLADSMSEVVSPPDVDLKQQSDALTLSKLQQRTSRTQ